MTRLIGRTLWSLALAAALDVSAARAQEPGETVEGVVAAVHEGSVTVARAGREVSVRVGPQTRVVVSPRSGGRFPDATVEFLRPGMTVSFAQTGGPLERIVVTGVPQDAWPEAPQRRRRNPTAAPGEGRELTARLIAVDARTGEIEVDAAGGRERYRLERASTLRGFAPGDSVLVVLDTSGQVLEVRDVALRGRVASVDPARGLAVVQVGGREETFDIVGSVLGDMRVGDRVRFEIEERAGGRRVITSWRRR